jgi:uncharacterized protein YcaQ
LIARVELQDDGRAVPGTWYIHRDDVSLLEQLERGDFEPRTTLLSPFDNLICDRARTRQLFDYDYTIEIYTPKHKRKYGYFVMSILHGDKLIGRVDPLMDRAQGRLNIQAVHAERGAPMRAPRKTARAIADAIEELGEFLGANEIVYSNLVPEAWRRALR